MTRFALVMTTCFGLLMASSAPAAILVDFDEPAAVDNTDPSYVSGSTAANFTFEVGRYIDFDSVSPNFSLRAGGGGGSGYGEALTLIDLGDLYTFDGVAVPEFTLERRRWSGVDSDDELYVELYNTDTSSVIASTADIAIDSGTAWASASVDLSGIQPGDQFDAIRISTQRFGLTDGDSIYHLFDDFEGNAVLVPEPATVGLLAIGGALMLVRRRSA